MKSLSVIIPSRNSSNLIPCVEAVRRCEPGVRIIVVDDGLDVIPVEVDLTIMGAKPFIFARNVNIGIQVAGHDDVILLNDDALLQTPGGFSLLQRTAQEHKELGIIAATTNNVGNSNQWPQSIGLRTDGRMVCFVAVILPRRTINVVGLLDTRYAGYGCDDDDYSFEVRKRNLQIGIHDGCYVDHGRLTSSFRGAAGAGGDFIPNLRLFIQKWGTDNWGKERAHSQFSHLFPGAAA